MFYWKFLFKIYSNYSIDKVFLSYIKVIIINYITGLVMITSITQLVLENEFRIGNVEGKDLVIFLGLAQVGITSTINALMGTKYKLVNKCLETENGSSNVFETGARGGESCTKFPQRCSHPDGKVVFLDTRGFFDTSKNREEEIASSILIEMAVNKAKSVRLVVLERYADISGGLVRFSRLGEIISKLAVRIDGSRFIPVLFVFNRFSCGDDEKSMEEYLKIPKESR
jgi:hypothetical protein